MNNIQELLDLAEPIFLQIDDASIKGDRRIFNRLLNSEQPKEWITELISEATGKPYYHNDIELIEGICDRLCFEWKYRIRETVITPTKSGIVITISVNSSFEFNFYEWTLTKDGIASQYVSSPAYMELASAKCASMAFKNSAKKLGNLLGKSLNRNLENAPVESVDVFEEAKSEFEKSCEAAENVEDLAKLKIGITPAQTAIYMKHLKRLTGIK